MRRRLKEKGHTLRTASDTEVIVHLYEEDPERFVEHLGGIFAFALWDVPRRQLTLARDYIGVKPLYYHEGSRCFVFASEIKAILADPRVPCAPDEIALVKILAFQNTYFSRTCFQDVRLLEPGEMLTVDWCGTVRRRKYWTFERDRPGAKRPHRGRRRVAEPPEDRGPRSTDEQRAAGRVPVGRDGYGDPDGHGRLRSSITFNLQRRFSAGRRRRTTCKATTSARRPG